MSEDARLLVSPSELKIVNAGVDTFLVNYKFVDENGNLTGASLPDYVVELLDIWQQEARAVHEPTATDLIFTYSAGTQRYEQTLLMRSHGSSLWSWLLFCDDVKLHFAHGTVNKGLFCQARFSSHLLHTIGPEEAMLAVEALLHELLGEFFHEQASEVHLCTDLQGFDFSTVQLVGGQLPFVSRVTSIRDRSVPPTDEEQEGGLSLGEAAHIEELIAQETETFLQEERFHEASIMTTHRRVATIDFGSHASDISAQIYNKSLEIKKRNKGWFEPIWRMNGWDGSSTVWRVEFRFKRAFLRKFELDEAFSVVQLFHLLWKYATQEWLRFVDLDQPHGVNVSRLPTHPVWEMIQHAYDEHEKAMLAARGLAGEKEARLAYVLHEKPLEAIKQAQALQLAERLRETFQDVSLLSVEESKQWFQEIESWGSVSFARFVLLAGSIVGVACYCVIPLISLDPLAMVSHLQQERKPGSVFPESLVDLSEKWVQTAMIQEFTTLERTLRAEPIEVVRDLARGELSGLVAPLLDQVISSLAPSSFVEVRTVLVKRAKQMAKLKACIAGGLGYLRSAVALMPQDELPGMLGPDAPASRTFPDLFSSMLWFFEKARAYDQEKHRDHREEVHKKRLAYGFVSASQLEEERRLFGADLCKEDYAAVDRVLSDLRAARKSQVVFDEEVSYGA